MQKPLRTPSSKFCKTFHDVKKPGCE